MATKKEIKRKSPRHLTLAAFFRKLWSTPGLLERFSESRAARAEVLGKFTLSARHRKLLLEGCVRDIIGELAGVTLKPSAETTVVNTTDDGADVSCGHPECEAFMRQVALARARPKQKR